MAVGKKTGGRDWKPGQCGNPLTQFQPGNPGGKKRALRDVEDELLERFGDKINLMVEFLLDGAFKKNISLVQIVAIEKAMDRIIGKARQRLEHSGPDGGAIPIKASDELLERAENLLKAAEPAPPEG